MRSTPGEAARETVLRSPYCSRTRRWTWAAAAELWSLKRRPCWAASPPTRRDKRPCYHAPMDGEMVGSRDMLEQIESLVACRASNRSEPLAKLFRLIVMIFFNHCRACVGAFYRRPSPGALSWEGIIDRGFVITGQQRDWPFVQAIPRRTR